MKKLRILLADDNLTVLETISRLLDGQFDTVAAVLDGKSAIEAVGRLDPDLVVLDISMPILDGLKTAARLRESGARAKVVFLTVHDDADYIEAAFSVGARGYVLKPRLQTDLLPALQEVLQGRTFVSGPVSVVQECPGIPRMQYGPSLA